MRIVIVAFHSPERLAHCLSLLGEEAGRVVVVDNSSSTAVRDVTRQHGSEYVDAEANLGFAGGVNLALRQVLQSEHTDVLLLNPDASLEAGDVRRLQEFLHREGNEQLAAVTPRLVGAGGLEQRVCWPFPTPGRAWVDAVGLGHRSRAGSFAIGAALLLRWEALQDVGLFDERFFLYAEEADWQRRAHARGWASAVCLDVVGVHTGAGTSTDERQREALFHAAQETYIRKWYGRSGWLIYRAAAVFGALARAIVLVGERRGRAVRRAGLYLRGPRRSAGFVRGG